MRFDVGFLLGCLLAAPSLGGPTSRILGGSEAQEGQFPYLVGVFVVFGDETYLCGGTILSQKTVLTAAHAVSGADSVYVKAGVHNIFEDAKSQIGVDFVTVHENFSQSIVPTNDIALLHLQTRLQYGNLIQPIALPRKSEILDPFKNTAATVAGWGIVSDLDPVPSLTLQWVRLQTMSEIECNRFWLGVISPQHLCTSSMGGKAPCDGDDGGPLVMETKEGPKQIGIASFGHESGCETHFPFVFTRLTEFLAWIEANSDVEILL